MIRALYIVCFLFSISLIQVNSGHLRYFASFALSDVRGVSSLSSPFSQQRGGFFKAPPTSSQGNRDEERVKIERTFVAIKPDGVERKLVGEIIQRLEKKGMSLIGMKMLKPSLEIVEKHYEAHKGKSFFEDLISFFSSGPIVAMVWEGNHAIELIRTVAGATHPENALPGTIRGDFCYQRGRTLIHSSDSAENAEREIKLWFDEKEILTTKP